MRSLFLLLFFILSTVSHVQVAAALETVSCAQLPQNARAGYREKLSSGGYGFCKVTDCATGYELLAGRCLPPTAASWFSVDKAIPSGAYTLTLYAQLNRTPAAPVSFNLSTTGSTASSNEYELVTQKITFSGSNFSDPILIKIYPVSGSRVARNVSLRIMETPSATFDGRASNVLELSLAPQSGTPVQLTVDDAVVTAGDIARIGVHLSAVHSPNFPTFITAKFSSGDQSALTAIQVDGNIAANRLSTLINIPTVNRTNGSSVSMDITVRTGRDITVVKGVSVITIGSKPIACDFGYHPDANNLTCLPDVLVPTFSEYFPTYPNMKACDGTKIGTRSVVFCFDQTTNSRILNVFCSDSSPTRSYQSPAGSRSCLVPNGTGTQACNLGSAESSACVAVTCEGNFHVDSGSCVANTYTATYSVYSSNPVSATCSGSGIGTRAITTCVRDHDGVGVNLSFCSDPSPTTQYLSPSGTRPCQLTNGAGVQSCTAGSTIWSACTLNTCNSGFHNESGQCVSDVQACSVANGAGTKTYDVALGVMGPCSVNSCATNFHISSNSCASDTYHVGSFSPYSTNSVTAICSGVSVSIRTIATCIRDHDGTAVSSSNCTDPSPSQLNYSPAGAQACPISNGSGTMSCGLGSTSWSSCSAASCDPDYHLNNGACVLNTYTATFGPYSPNTVSDACSGTAVSSRSISSCIRNHDSLPVATTFCSDPTPTITNKSPPGELACVISDGSGKQVCAEGSTVRSACTVASCNQYFHTSGNSCVSDTYVITNTSGYSPPNTVTDPCTGSVNASRSITGCRDEQSGALVPVDKCFGLDGQQNITFLSPAGSVSCPITNGAGSQSCAQGSSTRSSCVAISCNPFFHSSGNVCVTDTYTATVFSVYATNNVTAACSGIQVASRDITTCVDDQTGASVATSNCVDPAPTKTYQSPSGTRSCTVTNGIGAEACLSGSTTPGLCTVSSCNEFFHVSGNTCVPDTYAITATSSYSPNPVSLVCAGSATGTRVIIGCKDQESGAAVGVDRCAGLDPNPTILYQSPAGSQTCPIVSGLGSQSCALGSTSPSTCLVTSCNSGFYTAADNQSCVVNPSISPTTWSMNSSSTKLFSASGGTPPYTWTASAGTVSSNGVFSPSNTTGSTTVTVTDAMGHSASASVAVTAMWSLTISQPTIGLIGGAASSFLVEGTAVSVSFSGTNMAGTWTGACSGSLMIPCSFTMSADKFVGASVSCNPLFHAAGRSCLPDTFTASYSPYSPASLPVCGGSTTGSRTISLCVDDQTSQPVATANCSDPSPTTTISSPAGSQSCAVTNGIGTQSCAAGSSSASVCTVVSCATNYYPAANNQSCVSEPTISPTAWSMNSDVTKQFAVSGGTAPFVWSSSLGSVSTSGLFTPANSSSTQTVTATDAMGHTTSALVTVTAMWSLRINQPSIGAIGGSSNGTYAQGTSITLTYIGSSTIGNWTGACSSPLSSACTFVMNTDSVVGASVSCNPLFHASSGSCVSDTFTASYGAYSPSALPVCGGTTTGNRIITFCLDDQTFGSVATSNCFDPSPSTLISSPSGSQACSIANGSGSQSCAGGSTNWSSCSVVSCSTNFHQVSNACVADTYTATFNPYEANTVTSACAGTQVASRSIATCTRSYDSTSMALSFCTDPSPTQTYQSPAGAVSCSVSNGSGAQSCAIGSSVKGACNVTSCASLFHVSVDGLSCIQDTFSASYTPYSANTVTSACSGTAIGTRSISLCIDDQTGSSVSTSNCLDPSPSVIYQSPSGSVSCSIGNGNGSQSCSIGSTTKGACTVSSCNAFFHAASDGLSCVPDTYTSTAFSSYSANTVTSACTGTATGTRAITTCVDDQTGASVATSRCVDPAPTTTYQSPAGAVTCSVSNGVGSQSCAVGSATRSACMVASCNSLYHPASDGFFCITDTFTAGFGPYASNTVTTACSGTQVASRSILSCTDDQTAASVPISNCTDPSSTTTYQSPAGSVSCSITNGSGLQACAQGSTSRSTCTVLSCDPFFHNSSNSCVPDTYTVTSTSAYSPVNGVTTPCSGTQSASRTITGCQDVQSGASVTVDRCAGLDLQSTTTYQSPSGSVACAISNGTGSKSCSVGSASGTCFATSCSSGFFLASDNLSCIVLPSISPTGSLSVNYGSSFQFLVSGGAGPFTWTATSGGVSSAGLFTPINQSGTVTVTVTDSYGHSSGTPITVVGTYHLTINQPTLGTISGTAAGFYIQNTTVSLNFTGNNMTGNWTGPCTGALSSPCTFSLFSDVTAGATSSCSSGYEVASNGSTCQIAFAAALGNIPKPIEYSYVGTPIASTSTGSGIAAVGSGASAPANTPSTAVTMSNVSATSLSSVVVNGSGTGVLMNQTINNSVSATVSANYPLTSCFNSQVSFSCGTADFTLSTIDLLNVTTKPTFPVLLNNKQSINVPFEATKIVQVSSINPIGSADVDVATRPVAYNGDLYFVGFNSTNQKKLFRLNSSNNTINQVSNINSSGSDDPLYLTAYGGGLYFRATLATTNTRLFKLVRSGGIDTITQVSNFCSFANTNVPGDDPKYLVTFNNSASGNSELYFIANSGTCNVSNGISRLMKIVNTSGTDIISTMAIIRSSGDFSTNTSAVNPSITEFNGSLYFISVASSVSTASRLWRLSADGSVKQVSFVNSSVGDFPQASQTTPQYADSNIAVSNGVMYLTMGASNSTELYRAIVAGDGSITYSQIANSNTLADNPKSLTPYNGFLYFVANNASGVTKLFKVDSIGTLTQISNFSGTTTADSIFSLGVYNNDLYLIAKTSSIGNVKVLKVNASDYVSQVSNMYPGFDDAANTSGSFMYIFNSELYLPLKSSSSSSSKLFKISN